MLCINVFLLLLLPCFVERSELNAKSVDPDQTQLSLIWVYTSCQCPIYGTQGINDDINMFIPEFPKRTL